VNKKQKKLALNCALDALAQDGKLFIVDSIEVASGKTKDAKAMFDKLGVRDALFVKEIMDEKTYLAFRNIQSTYIVEGNELNAFLAATYRSVVIEKAVWENLTKEA
jgi:large subunit ribosomal protein L4